jgi:hypothetical protein
MQIEAAKRYNVKQIGRLFEIDDFPEPWSHAVVGDGQFEYATALFQKENGLVVDGKMGPKTWARVRVQERVKEDTNPGRPSVMPNGFSNKIIVAGEHVVLPDSFLKAGLTASNYLDDGEPHFKRKKRVKPLDNFVIHETCGNTASGCKRTLKNKGYGVQLILAANGHLSCHGDLATEVMIHANQLNNVSFGMEIVNPYSPIFVSDEAIWFDFLKAQWWTWIPSKKSESIKKLLKRKGLLNVPKMYVKPTKAQMAASRLIVPWICHLTGVPYRFPTMGLSKKKRKIIGWNFKPKAKPGPGVVSHRDFACHADGRYILDDLIERAKK